MRKIFNEVQKCGCHVTVGGC